MRSFQHQSGWIAATVVIAIVMFATTWYASAQAAPADRHAADVAQGGHAYFVPHLVSAGYDPGSRLDGGDRGPTGLHGMVGFGESTLEMQNRTENSVDVNVLFTSMFAFDDVVATRRLDPMGEGKIVLKHTEGVTFSDYAARVTANHEIGLVTRSTWEGGAMAVTSAPEPASKLLLPLFAVDVYSHTTILQLTNTDINYANDVYMELFNRNGRLVREFRFGLDAGESGRVDPFYLIDFDGLPKIAGGGYIGSARFTSDLPIAIMAYGDEAEGRGATAITARPLSKADVAQHLPLVRANVGGDSLIAVANAGDEAVDVTIRYLGAANSPSGAGQTFEQSLSIGGRYHAIIDLDPQRKRGTAPSPDLPRGSSLGRGFFGSASVQASGPVLVSVLEQDLRYDDTGLQRVLTSAAYNAFGTGDLAKTFVVPRARVGLDEYTTNIVILNPGSSNVEVTVDWVAGGPHGAEREWWGPNRLAPGHIAAIVPTLFQNGLPAQAIVKASSPVAVLVYDVAAEKDLGAYWPVKVPDDTGELPEPIWATATFTPSATPTHTPTATSRWPQRTPEATPTLEGEPTSRPTRTPTTEWPTDVATNTPDATEPAATPSRTMTVPPVSESTVYLPRCYRP